MEAINIMELEEIKNIIVESLEDSKARDIQVMDVAGVSSFADIMIVATGTSTTHVRSTGNSVAQKLKDLDIPPLGVEAGPQPDWVLVDAGDIIVHVMTEAARAHYSLEKLWDVKLAEATPTETAD